jgi:thiol:disulfide interchange protein DsbD
VQAKLAGWTLLQADVTANSDADKALLQRFGSTARRESSFFDRTGKGEGVRVVGDRRCALLLQSADRQRVVGFQGPPFGNSSSYEALPPTPSTSRL